MRHPALNNTAAETTMGDGTFVIEKLKNGYELSVEYTSTEPGGTDTSIYLASGTEPSDILAKLNELSSHIEYLKTIVRAL